MLVAALLAIARWRGANAGNRLLELGILTTVLFIGVNLALGRFGVACAIGATAFVLAFLDLL